MIDTEIEEWVTIREFPSYDISNLGNIFNKRTLKTMRSSVNNFGHVKISLTAENGERYTRSVAQLVAEAFVEPPTPLCDQVVILDGNFKNVSSDNLIWRPGWFAWKYTRQLKIPQPIYYKNLSVLNVTTGVVYRSVIEAGMLEGLLFEDIWRSTYTGAVLFPYDSRFEIIE